MSQPLVIAGPKCRLYVNNKIYSVAQSVGIEVDTGSYSIYGINSPYPQEIASGQVSVKGSVKGVRIRGSGGLQGSNALPLFSDVAAANYVSMRLEDRQSGETIWSVPKCKLGKISESVQVKGVYQVSFDFIGQILYWPLDLS